MVVCNGDAIGLEQVEQLKLVIGPQVYVLVLLVDIILVDAPKLMVTSGLTVMVGVAISVIVAIPLPDDTQVLEFEFNA